MTDDRLNALDARLRAVEDELAILRLLATYGPLVDSGCAEEAAELWTEDGIYEPGGVGAMEGRPAIASLYRMDRHRELVARGSMHHTALPKVVLNGDRAEAVGYSFVAENAGAGFSLWRASINRWLLCRTGEGWRIVERRNRVLDGSDEALALLRSVR
ncbi:nuclear transport factor 2 family protein [Pelagerythrobacter aerophilus]|uniref:Nuclear transport factor 2 family protein n=1 Tax=Pelagerythrobacter aerophilus TaxID=2306995 RepID=A0A418NF75_9SPHN|nr:nuclear transport factor 2 family protein [Pelagerythrobacter aerophilus]RIV75884.1 nuclear transport factor 2 family protein [Pelagerythrobacter aerophilus]